MIAKVVDEDIQKIEISILWHIEYQKWAHGRF